MHWQNLIHKKCPKCDARLRERDRGLICPERDCSFAIALTSWAKIMTDPSHVMHRFLSPHERETLNTALAELGVVVDSERLQCQSVV